MWLFGLLATAGLVLLVAVAVRAFAGGITHPGARGGTGGGSGRSRARQILDERYARGELTTEQYQEQLHSLDEG